MFLALYGDNVNIAEAIFISIFSMAVVFVVLLTISYMIDVVALVISKGFKKKSVEVKRNDIPVKTNDDTVAVIAATIAAYLGTNIDNIKIKKIKRIKRISNSTWRI